MLNRRWILAHRPEGRMARSNFVRQDSEAIRTAPSGDAVRLRHELLLCAPTIRNWIGGNRSSYYPTVEIGQPVMAPALSRIVESSDPDWPSGTRVLGLGSWQDFDWVRPSAQGWRKVPDDVTSLDAMGPLGTNALTAYAGLRHVGEARSGETLLVSGAAGSVGSTAVQIGSILGCRVVALCGSSDKARWLRDDCGIDAVINYRDDDIGARLDALCPQGIDLFFDNVGGEILRMAVARMNRRGRVMLCGQIASYDAAPGQLEPPLDMMRIVYGGIKLHGFLVSHYAKHRESDIAQLRRWVEGGLLKHRMDIRDGFERVPENFGALFDGSNNGTLIARIADENGNPL